MKKNNKLSLILRTLGTISILLILLNGKLNLSSKVTDIEAFVALVCFSLSRILIKKTDSKE